MSAAIPTPGLELAVAFAALTSRGDVQAWMLWEGWAQHVGCYRCAGDGPDAPCWGVEGCHSFDEDCGCVECAALEAAELESERARSLVALARDLGDPEALRDELAGVTGQIDHAMDGGRAG
jgi:hypothetical protein